MVINQDPVLKMIITLITVITLLIINDLWVIARNNLIIHLGCYYMGELVMTDD